MRTAPALAAALVVAGLPACGVGPFATSCLPPALSVAPERLAAGQLRRLHRSGHDRVSRDLRRGPGVGMITP